MFSSIPTQPPEFQDYEELAAAKASVMIPHDLQEIVDLADVVFTTDGQYLGNWRAQVAAGVAKAARDGDQWAFDVLGLTEPDR